MIINSISQFAKINSLRCYDKELKTNVKFDVKILGFFFPKKGKNTCFWVANRLKAAVFKTLIYSILRIKKP